MMELPMVMPSRIDQIRHLQAEMSKLPQVELPTDHFFADGMYARRLFIPASATVVGKIHRYEHFFMLMFGDLSVVMDEGTVRMAPGEVHTSKPMAKRAMYAHADTMIITVHRTDLVDLDEIEDAIIVEEEGALFDARNHLKVLP